MIRRTLLSLSMLVLLATPVAAFAAPASTFLPLVPCGGTTDSGAKQPPCTPCYLFQAAKNATDLVLYGLTGPLAAFMIVVAGGMFLLGAGNAKMQAQARTLFTNTMLGIGIVLISWLATDFLIKSLGGGGDNDRWYEFTCPQFLSEIEVQTLEVEGGAPPGVSIPPVSLAPPKSGESGISGISGTTYAEALAKASGAKFPKQNSSALNTLIDCIYQDPVIKALTFPKPTTSGRQVGNFTYDNDHELCNYTFGNPPYGTCSHGRSNSCHYGNRTNSQGAEAIDFNALLKTVTIPGKFEADGTTPLKVYASEATLFCELHRLLITEKKCPNYKLLNWEGDHTHISDNTCDYDGPKGSQGASQSLPPGGCPPVAEPPRASGAPAPSSNP